MNRKDVTTLEQALLVLGRLGARGVRQADDLADGVMALLDTLDLVGLLDPCGEQRASPSISGDLRRGATTSGDRGQQKRKRIEQNQG